MKKAVRYCAGASFSQARNKRKADPPIHLYICDWTGRIAGSVSGRDDTAFRTSAPEEPDVEFHNLQLAFRRPEGHTFHRWSHTRAHHSNGIPPSPPRHLPGNAHWLRLFFRFFQHHPPCPQCNGATEKATEPPLVFILRGRVPVCLCACVCVMGSRNLHPPTTSSHRRIQRHPRDGGWQMAVNHWCR